MERIRNITNKIVTKGAPAALGIILDVYRPPSATDFPMSGYRKSLIDHSINQNKYIKGINDLYLKITIQHTPQKINWAKPHKEKNI